jgi:hypothetical protein
VEPSELPVSAETLATHDRVVRFLADQVDAALPARFGWIADEATIDARLASHRQSLLDALDLTAGREQMNDDVQRSVVRLVLSLVEFLRQLLERQAIKRMEGESLTPEEVEAMGLALMKLEETVHELAQRFGLRSEDLNLDLGRLV